MYVFFPRSIQSNLYFWTFSNRIAFPYNYFGTLSIEIKAAAG
jgi:hypothetical protein